MDIPLKRTASHTDTRRKGAANWEDGAHHLQNRNDHPDPVMEERMNKRFKGGGKGVAEPKAAGREGKLIVKTKRDKEKANEQGAKMHNISPEAASQASSIKSTRPEEGPAQQAGELRDCCLLEKHTKLCFYWPRLLLGAASLLGPLEKVGPPIGVKKKRKVPPAEADSAEFSTGEYLGIMFVRISNVDLIPVDVSRPAQGDAVPVRSLAQRRPGSTQSSDLPPRGHGDNAMSRIVPSSVTSSHAASGSQVSSYFYNLSLIMLMRLQSHDATEATFISNLHQRIESLQAQLQAKDDVIAHLERLYSDRDIQLVKICDELLVSTTRCNDLEACVQNDIQRCSLILRKRGEYFSF